MIECEVTRMVAERATEAMLAPLRRNVEEETSHRWHGRLREAIRLSGEFHILLGQRRSNDILAGMVRHWWRAPRWW